MFIRIIAMVLLLAHFTVANAQQFNTDQQYQQAMKNAKTALSANQYSQAVMFYREALALKPNELLPGYKIEDIRTIYIKNELDSLKVAQVPPVEKKRKKKKEIEAEHRILEEKAELLASEKMNQEADIAKQELKQLTVTANVLNIDEQIVLDEDDEIEIENTASNRVVAPNVVEKKEIVSVPINSENKQSILIVETRKAEVTQQETEEPLIKEKLSQKETRQAEPIKKAPVKTKKVTKPSINDDWIKQENWKLLAKYPNKKTVEEIEKPGKHITRVIMNIDSKVTVYLKVKHSWGATYFFVDEVGIDLRSISEIHFNLMTDENKLKDKN